MTLLLAFFIILQAFATEQEAGLFHAGRGSFIRALRTFGLGGVFHGEGAQMLEGNVGPRYKATEGETTPPRSRRIDPELEAAQEALQSLRDEHDVRDAESAIGHRVELSTPLGYAPGDEGLSGAEQEFLRDLGPRLERVLLARGFVIRIGAELVSREEVALDQAAAALAAAEEVRGKLIEGMAPGVQDLARRRMYTFLRSAPAEAPPAEDEPWQLKVDVLLTKPYLEQAREEGTHSDESNDAG